METPEQQLSRAILLAVEAHKGQVDKYGQPYIGHPFRVMSAGHTLHEKMAGILHDVVEDTSWTIEQLEKENFPKEVIDAVDALTLRESETYDEYITRLEKNSLAVRVKLNDLSDNMDIRRCDKLTEEDIPRLQKYLKAYKRLTRNEK